MSLHITAPGPTIHRTLLRRCPAFPGLPPVKRKVLEYQLVALSLLARAYNRPGARILEIGTGHGGSGWVLAKSAPLAEVVSVTPVQAEADAAGRFWAAEGCRNIHAECERSWDRLARTTDRWDLVWVDGDHNQIARDLPWFDRLTDDGLFLCHDYSPQDSRSPSGIVYAELNAMAARLGRPFDVLVVDEGKVGMAGFYRRLPAARAAGVPATRTFTTSPPPVRAAPTLREAGIVGRSARDQVLLTRAAEAGVRALLSDAWELPWPRTLFVSSSAIVPWDLVHAGFDLVAKWDLAAPLSVGTKLASQAGTDAERAQTATVIGDLRIPLYSPDLVFVRDSEAGRACWEQWRAECAAGGDRQLAFLRALAIVTPRICALPRIWLAPFAERDALNRRVGTRPSVLARQLRRKR